MAPELPWEIPVSSTTLVCAALARARPVALASGAPRPDGLEDDVVAARYAELRAAVTALAETDPAVARRLADLEAIDGREGWTRWQTVVWATHADDDADVVRLARAVWEALGPHEYALRLVPRPRTWRGFLEGRAWVIAGALGFTLFALLAADPSQSAGPWWLWLPAIAGWPVLVWHAFWARWAALERRPGREFPHL